MVPCSLGILTREKNGPRPTAERLVRDPVPGLSPSLHIRFEYELPVSPLMLPDLSKKTPQSGDVELLSRSPAVQLFLQRAQVLQPAFTLTSANARAIAEICVYLDGLPLSIELAAARIRLLSPDKLLIHLRHRLDLLTGGARDLPERQQTLRNTLKWSYDLLTEREQQLFSRLAVFAGGCTLEAAEAIVHDTNHQEISVLDGLTSLLDNHLLQRKEEAEETRLIMLETIREYALDCLEMRGEMEITRRAHAEYYATWLGELNQEPGQRRDTLWLSQLEQEQDNLRETLSWLIERKEAEKALDLCSALRRFWETHGTVSEGRRWLESALSSGSEAPAAVRAKALNSAAELAYIQGAYGQTEVYCRESIALFQELGDRQGIALSLTTLGFMERSRGCYTAAAALREESLAVYRELENPQGITLSLLLLGSVLTFQGNYTRASTLVEEGLAKARAWGYTDALGDALNIAATIAFFQGDYARARCLIEENLALHQTLGDQRGRAYDLSFLGAITLWSEHDHSAARNLIEEALALCQKLGDQRAVAKAHYRLGCVALDQDDHSGAQASYMQCLAILWEVEDTWLIAASLEKLAQVALAQERPAWAARLCGCAEVLRETMDGPLPPIERPTHADAVAASRAHLGEKLFALIWAEGRAMTPQQACTARESALPQQASALSKSPIYPLGLTSREVDILRLVAEGLTDAQVGEKRVLSPRTVSAHLRSIYNKLGINSRAAATRFALENHLV